MAPLRIIGLIMGIMLIVFPAFAEVIVDETFDEYEDTSGKSVYGNRETNTQRNDKYKEFFIRDISQANWLNYVVIDTYSTYGSMGAYGNPDQGRWVDTNEKIAPGRYDFTYTLGSGESARTGPGVLYLSKDRNVLNQVTATHFTLFLNEWNVTGLSGTQKVSLPFYYGECAFREDTSKINGNIYHPGANQGFPVLGLRFTYSTANRWMSRLLVTTDESDGYNIDLFRNIDGLPSTTKIDIYDKNDVITYTSERVGIDESVWSLKDLCHKITLTSSTGNLYNVSMTTTPDDPGVDSEDHSVTVYIKNSQTGALIANANVAIDALVDGEYYPVTNRTEPSGIFTITLQPTGGGKPNPDSYRLIVTADGYNNPMPEINFTVDDYKNYIYCLLDPIAGGPADENKTFIDFFVRDMSSNPISGATVKFGKYTLITNSAGYTVFEVDKNNNYSWTISKSGYGPLTGNAVIGNDPRHTINTVLAPIVTPTTTTPIPTSPPIGPTPTMTAPTGEPVSNWLEWFAAHFGMLLGGGVEIGKIFMWLCFTVPVGVYVGKEAKAGAAGFMAGAGIVTLFFVLIGWVPIWLVVLMALIIGLLYAKAFNSQDNGGGR